TATVALSIYVRKFLKIKPSKLLYLKRQYGSIHGPIITIFLNLFHHGIHMYVSDLLRGYLNIFNNRYDLQTNFTLFPYIELVSIKTIYWKDGKIIQNTNTMIGLQEGQVSAFIHRGLVALLGWLGTYL
ncbi:hypothetical protein ACJX0J_020990, partial [Zea mays]